MDRMEFVPAGHRVLIEVWKPPEKTRGGIIIAAPMRNKEELSAEVGIIRGIGPTAFEVYGGVDRWNIKEGQRVLFVRQGGKVLPVFNGDELRMPTEDEPVYRIVNDEDIVGICREDA